MRGFGVEALDFYEDLEDDNTKTFWVAHRGAYEQHVRAPMLALMAALEPEFGPGKVFRPYRDLRYAADKTPYKTHQGGFVPRAPGTGPYVQISAAGLRTEVGMHHAERDALARYRAAVDDECTGTELERVLEHAAGAGLERSGDVLVTRPRGVESGHPRLGLLRHRSLVLVRDHGAPPWLHTDEVVERVRADWRAGEPLLAWLQEHVFGGDRVDVAGG